MSSERGAVQLQSVTKRFGAVAAVDGINLDVRPGEFLSLLGPSGCGKTTTLRMLAGFEQPDEGVILISGQPVQGIPPYKRDVNTVFQHYALFPHMTVAENVAYGLRQSGTAKTEIRQRVGEALEMVKMSALANRRPRQMSGGQQQRVAVARALVNRPSVLLLDEPLGALDRKLRQEMQIELKLLQSQLGITFIFVTHDQEEALSMSDRIAVMLEGHIEQLADPDTIYEQPGSAFVAGFIGQNNFFAGTYHSDGAVALDGGRASLRAGRTVDVVSVGSRALVSVRPEAMQLVAERPADPVNALEGMVAGVSHLGDVIQFVVRSGAHELLSRQPRHSAVKARAGEPVWCTWSSADAYLFSDRQARSVLTDPASDATGSPAA